MAPFHPVQTPIAADFDVIQNRVAIALANRERLVKSWTALSSRERPAAKTQEELDAVDADLFRFEPPHLGLGAPIPKEYLEGDIKRREIANNEKLRHLMLGNKSGLKGSKLRDVQEKAASAKRGLKEASSDEDEGRSGLGKAKKFKNGNSSSVQSPLPNARVKSVIGQTFKPVTKQNDILHLTHDSFAVIKTVSVQHVTQDLPGKSSSFEAFKKQDLALKKPLVDYWSDDDDNVSEDDTVSKQASPPKQHTVPKAPSGGLGQVLKNSGASHSTGTADKCNSGENIDKKSMTPPILPLTSKLNHVRIGRDTKQESKSTLTKRPSKSISSHSSSKRSSMASSTDSELSDMETAIPLALTTGDPTQPIIPSTISAVEEAKRAKKRQKRARKREREQQQKALVLTNSRVGKAPVVLNGGSVVTKKLKDRLLDANGN